MELPIQFTLAQLSPEQRARVITLLVEMILRQWNPPGKEPPDDAVGH